MPGDRTVRARAADETPLVSVIMNCYNGDRYLREAIASVYTQTYPRWEIVFWDNASTDRSAAIARSFDDRVRYFRGTTTVPLGQARNLALEVAKGDLLAFLDTDDRYYPDTLARQVSAIVEGGYAASYGGFVAVDADGQPFRRYIPRARTGHVFDALLRHFDIFLPTVVLRRSALEATGLSFDPAMTASEDYCFFLQLAVEQPFAVVRDAVAEYRIHDRALTNVSIARWAEEREYTLDRICERYPGIRERYRGPFDVAYARAGYYRARYHAAAGNRKQARAEMRRICAADYRYLALYLSLFFPVGVWNWVHGLRTSRVRFRTAARSEG